MDNQWPCVPGRVSSAHPSVTAVADPRVLVHSVPAHYELGGREQAGRKPLADEGQQEFLQGAGLQSAAHRDMPVVATSAPFSATTVPTVGGNLHRGFLPANLDAARNPYNTLLVPGMAATALNLHAVSSALDQPELQARSNRMSGFQPWQPTVPSAPQVMDAVFSQPALLGATALLAGGGALHLPVSINPGNFSNLNEQISALAPQLLGSPWTQPGALPAVPEGQHLLVDTETTGTSFSGTHTAEFGAPGAPGATQPPTKSRRVLADPGEVGGPGKPSKTRGHCEHGRRRSDCKECKGAGICEHSKRRSLCKECGGSCICPHGRIRYQCKLCGGSQICEHSRRRSHCKDCRGSAICEHRRQRHQCKQCKALDEISPGCPHGRTPQDCPDCTDSAASAEPATLPSPSLTSSAPHPHASGAPAPSDLSAHALSTVSPVMLPMALGAAWRPQESTRAAAAPAANPMVWPSSGSLVPTYSTPLGDLRPDATAGASAIHARLTDIQQRLAAEQAAASAGARHGA